MSAETNLAQRIIEDNAASTVSKQQGTTIFVVDGSGSIGSSTFHGAVKQVLSSLTISFPANEEIGVLQFSSTVRWETDYQHSPVVPSSHRASLFDQIEKMQYLGQSTNTRKAIEVAWTTLQPRVESGNRGRIFLITDGKPNEGSDPGAAIKGIAATGTAVYVIGVGSGIDMNLMRSWTLNSFAFGDFETLIKLLQTKGVAAKQPVLNIKVYPSLLNAKLNTFQPKSNIYLTVEIFNSSLDPVPAGMILTFEKSDYFMQRKLRIKQEIPDNESIRFEIDLKTDGTATELNFPEEVFWNIAKTEDDPPIIRGAIVVGTEFLAREYLPQPARDASGKIDPNAPTEWGNCLVFGIMGSGKSSLLNALLTSMTTATRPLKRLNAVKSSDHVTTSYDKITFDDYQRIMLTGGQRFPIHFWDSWGLNLGVQNYKKLSLSLLLKGFLPDGAIMPSDDEPPAGLVPNEDRRIHAVLFVMAAGHRHMDSVVSLLQQHIMTAVREGYTPMLVVTHVDMEEDYDPKNPKILLNELHAKLGVNADAIFLFQNYTEENQRSSKIDHKSRYLIGQILQSIHDFKIRQHLPQLTKMPPVTTSGPVDFPDIPQAASSTQNDEVACPRCHVSCSPPPPFCPNCGQKFPDRNTDVPTCPKVNCSLFGKPLSSKFCGECGSQGQAPQPKPAGQVCKTSHCIHFGKPISSRFCGECGQEGGQLPVCRSQGCDNFGKPVGSKFCGVCGKLPQ